jgi:hypothetical protein
MKKLKVFSWCLLIALTCFFVLSVGLFGKALAAPIFSDDFESYAQGTFPGAGGWVIIHNGAGDTQQYVDTSQAASGTQSFRTMGSNCWAASLSKSLTIPNRVRLEAKVFVDQLVACGCTELQAQVGLWRSDDTMWAGAIIFGCDGNIYASKQSGFPLVLLTSYSVGRWYDVRVDYDYTSKTFDVFIDGFLRGQAIPILDDLTNKIPNAVRVGAAHGSSPIAWFDDVKVSEITCVSPPSDLVSWWSGDNTANDIIGSNHGTMMSGATFAPGMVGEAFSFDGTEASFVEIPNSSELNPSGAFSVDGWFYIDPNAPGNVGGESSLVAKTSGGVGDGGWFLWFQDSNAYTKALRFDILTWGSPAWPYAEVNNIITSAGWYHIAGVFDLTSTPQAKLYVNGALVASSSSTITAILNNTLPVRIGASHWTDVYHAGNDRLNGKADEVEFFNRALTAEEIAAIYNAGSAGKCKPCTSPPSGVVSWWKGENNTLDMVGANHGTLQGGATYGAGKIGQAFSFDGVDDYFFASNALTIDGGSEATYDAWVYPKAVPALDNYFGIFGAGDSTLPVWTTQQCRILYFRTGDSPTDAAKFYMDCGTNDFEPSYKTRFTSKDYPINKWYFVTGVFNNGTLDIYVNGVLDNGTEGGMNAGTFINTNAYNYVWIGATVRNDQSFSGAHFNSLIDEIEIFNRALSAEEIAAIYAAGSAGKCSFTTIYVSKDDHCGGNKPCFPHIQNGIASASIPATIKITGETYIEDILLDFSRQLTLQGGWDTSFTSDSSYTTIDGSLTIKHGTMIVEYIILQ